LGVLAGGRFVRVLAHSASRAVGCEARGSVSLRRFGALGAGIIECLCPMAVASGWMCWDQCFGGGSRMTVQIALPADGCLGTDVFARLSPV
jgi:hypothetical protein